MDYATYPYSGGRGLRGPTPTAPPSVPFGRGSQPPTRRLRQIIDEIHESVNDENLDGHVHIGDIGEASSSGVESPAVGDDDCDCEDES